MTKRISDLPVTSITDLESLDAACLGLDNHNASPAVSNQLTLRQIHGSTYDLWPTGSAATDTVAFETLVKRMPLSGGTLRIMDNGYSLVLDPAYSASANTNGVVIYSLYLGQILINKPMFIRGESQACRIQLNNGYLINWGLTENLYTSNQRVVINQMPAGSSVVSGWTSGYLQRGDWVLLTSDDAIPTSVLSPHYAAGSQKPGEIHRVAYTYPDDGVNYAVLDGCVVDALTTQPRMLKLNMLRNCGMADITLGSHRTMANTSQWESNSEISLALDVNRTVGFRIENVIIDDTAAGALKIDYSADTLIQNFSGYAVPDNSIDYALIIGTCNGLLYRDSTWHNSRHVVTTGGDAIGQARYGTPLNVTVSNITAHQGGSFYADILTAFDTHPEGFNVIFEDCRVFAGGRDNCYGFGGRARKSVYRNCSFHGAKPSYTGLPSGHQAFVIAGSDALIDGGYVYNAAIGVRLRTYQTNVYQHNCRVTNVTFDEVFGAVLHSEDPINNVQLDNCAAKNCSTHYYASPQYPAFFRALVQLYNGTGHKIRGNFFDRQNNDYVLNPYSVSASAFELVGNHCRGYTQRFSGGSNKIGIRGDSGDPNGTSSANAVTIQNTWASANYTS